MKDYLKRHILILWLSLQSEYQSLKESYRQRRPQLRAMLGLFGKALKKMKGRLEQIWFGYHHVEVSLKKKGTMKRVWQHHILSPQVTPRKETYFQKIKNAFIYRQKNKKINFIKK